MKVLHVNTFDTGGAAKACIGVHLGLLNKGCDSNLLTLFKYTSTIPNHVAYAGMDSIIVRGYKSFRFRSQSRQNKKILNNQPPTSSLFSFPDSVYDITNTQEYKAADIIHLHWVSNFLDYPSFFLKNEKPVVWTPHDMNPFTGGCHSSLDCNGYQNSCRDCPQLSSLSRADEARNILSGKRGALLARKAPLAIASLSGWMHECSQKSSIFRDLPNYVIPNSINTAVFKPQNQLMARQIMNLPADKKILFFLSDDIQNKLKGFHLLLECLSYLKNIENVILVSVGRATGSLGNVSIPHMHLGYISDEEQLSAVYNSADLLINPSLAESFSLVTLEAMACGIPVAAFRTGGILNLVREGKTGLLAATGDAGQLAEKVAWLLQNEKSRKEMGILASQIAADQYTRDRQVVNYLKIYESLYQQF